MLMMAVASAMAALRSPSALVAVKVVEEDGEESKPGWAAGHQPELIELGEQEGNHDRTGRAGRREVWIS
jgi:hypothetical protein